MSHRVNVEVPREYAATFREELSSNPGDELSVLSEPDSGPGLALDTETIKLIIDATVSLTTVITSLTTTWLAVRATRRAAAAAAGPETSGEPVVVLELATRDVTIPIFDGAPQLPADLPATTRDLLTVRIVDH